MIKETNIAVSPELYQRCGNCLPKIDFKLSLNQPTGRFFYDPWEIKPEFKHTPWDEILQTLPPTIGEARLIKLEPGNCYFSHGDIDDRYHLNLSGRKSYLVDLDNNIMHALPNTGNWYTINTAIHHSAVNFGDIPRIQLVVRQLLNNATIAEYKKISIVLDTSKPDYRYQFDEILSPWLNLGCKSGIINNFTVVDSTVNFNLHSAFVNNLYAVADCQFNITAT